MCAVSSDGGPLEGCGHMGAAAAAIVVRISSMISMELCIVIFGGKCLLPIFGSAPPSIHRRRKS